MSGLYLLLAITLEVIGTTAMKLSEGFSKPWPGAVMVISYAACFGFLTLALKGIEVSKAYAIWSGVGTALIAVVGILWFREPLSAVKIGSLLLIILGVVGLNLTGAH